MLPCRPRSGSWGGEASEPRPRHKRSNSTSTYSPPSSESYGGGLMEQVVAQLEEQLRAEREEKARALQELMEMQHQHSDGAKEAACDARSDSERVRFLEREVAVAKMTEMKMLESLIHQTKELEQAKIALEETKLEAATLRHGRAGAGGVVATAEPAAQWSVMDLMFGGVDEEINGLRGKLRAAVQAEERARKAADELTAALSAVTMEAKQVKAWLSDAQDGLEGANAEVDRLKGLLHAADAELWSMTERVDGLTSEWKEAGAALRAREKALLGRVRAAEDDADAARQENVELAELHHAATDENASLRSALDRAMEEADAANESLELAASDNSRLQDAIADKESAMASLRQENETLKASEAEARERAKELDGQLAAAKKAADCAAGENATGLSLDKWRPGDMPSKLSAAFLDSSRVMASRKDRMFASLSNIAELRSAAAAAAAMDDFDYEFDHLDGGQYGDVQHAMKHKKRRSVLRKFGDFFRRGSLYKPNLAPVMHY